jgi:hypothetical protein
VVLLTVFVLKNFVQKMEFEQTFMLFFIMQEPQQNAFKKALLISFNHC